MVASAGRPGGGAVAAQVHRDDVEVLRELVGDFVPDEVGLRVAVQEEERRALATGAAGDAHLVEVDREFLVLREHLVS